MVEHVGEYGKSNRFTHFYQGCSIKYANYAGTVDVKDYYRPSLGCISAKCGFTLWVLVFKTLYHHVFLRTVLQIRMNDRFYIVGGINAVDVLLLRPLGDLPGFMLRCSTDLERSEGDRNYFCFACMWILSHYPCITLVQKRNWNFF